MKREKLIQEYYELLLESQNDEQKLLEIENFIKYAREKHDDMACYKPTEILLKMAYYHRCNKESYETNLKYAGEEDEIKELVSLIETYEMYIKEVERLIVAKQMISSHKIKRDRLEKRLTKEEKEFAYKKYLLALESMKEDKGFNFKLKKVKEL